MQTTPDVLENWRTVGEIIAAVLSGAVLLFLNVYRRYREQERGRAESSPTVATQAIGAAILDRSTADAATRMAEDMRASRASLEKLEEIAERWEEREQADKLAELHELRRLARERGG